MKKLLAALYKSYVVKTAIKDGARFLKKNLKNMELNRNYWLHKVGLSTWSPTRRIAGGLALVTMGAAAGSIAALAMAPKEGAVLRAEVKDKAKEMMARAQDAAEKVTSGVEAHA